MPERIQSIPHVMDRIEMLIDILRVECPWDKKQTLSSLRKHTLEETHEVIEAIDAGDWQELKMELGDLLLQIVFYARLAKEEEKFSLHDIADAAIEKMIRRHPHVFTASTPLENADDVIRQWDVIKKDEYARTSSMDGIPPLPALSFATKIQRNAAKKGFDWLHAQDVLPKLQEEIDELSVEIAAGNKAKIESEFGDVLFTLVNIARHLDIDAELSLMNSNRKFMRRFRLMESNTDLNVDLTDCTLAELEALYQQAKKEEARD
ncbi:MAG: nucleoside triphosphate pyrophosphohydrolase [Mariprofundales bacterium]